MTCRQYITVWCDGPKCPPEWYSGHEGTAKDARRTVRKHYGWVGFSSNGSLDFCSEKCRQDYRAKLSEDTT